MRFMAYVLVKKDGPKEKDTLEVWETETGNCVKGFCIKKRDNWYSIRNIYASDVNIILCSKTDKVYKHQYLQLVAQLAGCIWNLMHPRTLT